VKRILKLFTAFALVLSFLSPLTAHATSSQPPTNVFNYDLDGNLYDDPYMNGGYTHFMVPTLGGGTTLPVRIDAECALPKTSKIRVDCIDNTTKKVVSSKSIYATNHQYITFTNLDPSHYYYFYFQGPNNMAGVIYISENGLYPF
jgi:hypothetical protein